MGRVRVLAVVAMLVLGLALPGAVAAADVDFGTPSATSTFGTGVEFVQPVTLAQAAARVEVLITTADSLSSLVIELPPPVGGGAQTLRATLDPVADGHILPNTPMTARWRVFSAEDGPGIAGPAVDVVYDEDRFEWQTVSGDIVRVHWYEGGAAFGERALRIGEKAVAETAALLGVREDEPVDFFIYADQDTFYDALGPGTRENVGGQANAGIRTLFALISPGQIDDPWVRVVVPHELVHLVFDTAVGNPYHFPPRWLNEGLATYRSDGYGAGSRSDVESAARAGGLIPLDGLTGQFPTTAERFVLAYAQSVSAVDFLIRTHGEDALVALIRSYAEGRTDDEAFTAAIGMDVDAFSAAWLDDLEADAPTRHGPRPAPAGPVPAAWADGGTPGATSQPGAPTSAASATPGSGTPGAPAGPVDPAGESSSVAILIVILGVLIALGAVVLWRRRRPPPDTPQSAAP